jgi:hypothetical protein
MFVICVCSMVTISKSHFSFYCIYIIFVFLTLYLCLIFLYACFLYEGCTFFCITRPILYPTVLVNCCGSCGM